MKREDVGHEVVKTAWERVFFSWWRSPLLILASFLIGFYERLRTRPEFDIRAAESVSWNIRKDCE
jgi:hypothetical protein